MPPGPRSPVTMDTRSSVPSNLRLRAPAAKEAAEGIDVSGRSWVQNLPPRYTSEAEHDRRRETGLASRFFWPPPAGRSPRRRRCDSFNAIPGRHGSPRPMTEADLLTLFRRSGALLEGHYTLSSGLHSPGYLQCALVLSHPADATAIGAAIGERCRSLGATIVLSPALGGIVIGHEVARALGVPALFA